MQRRCRGFVREETKVCERNVLTSSFLITSGSCLLIVFVIIQALAYFEASYNSQRLAIASLSPDFPGDYANLSRSKLETVDPRRGIRSRTGR